MEAKRGDVKYYHESGVIWKVEVLDATKKLYGKTPGEEYQLRILEIIDSGNFKPREKGLEFSVWMAENAGAYAGWFLLDR